MGQGNVGVTADILPAMDKRVRDFTRKVIEKAILREPLDSVDIMNSAKKLGLVKAMHCTDENIEHWEHLPVELGDEIYQLVPELD
jgi:hypothetical protein